MIWPSVQNYRDLKPKYHIRVIRRLQKYYYSSLYFKLYKYNMILNEKQCSKNTLNLASTVIGKQKFSLELPQTVFQELLRYICNNFVFQNHAFCHSFSFLQPNVMTCEGSGTSRCNILLESYFLFFFGFENLWTLDFCTTVYCLATPTPFPPVICVPKKHIPLHENPAKEKLISRIGCPLSSLIPT